jgi:hypothetical protein
MVVFKKSFSTAGHDLVIKRIIMLTDQIRKISNAKHKIPIFNDKDKFGILNFGHCYLPFDLAQGGELVEPFDI